VLVPLLTSINFAPIGIIEGGDAFVFSTTVLGAVGGVGRPLQTEALTRVPSLVAKR
jgi:hypothetical protein